MSNEILEFGRPLINFKEVDPYEVVTECFTDASKTNFGITNGDLIGTIGEVVYADLAKDIEWLIKLKLKVNSGKFVQKSELENSSIFKFLE